mmetsp:Transcript_6400/g.10276  ORF Transcript_6400/g.10276 Transcript_6400/m.10276 type:complete len:88 (-) Transcript_6400:51-314(-)
MARCRLLLLLLVFLVPLRRVVAETAAAATAPTAKAKGGRLLDSAELAAKWGPVLACPGKTAFGKLPALADGGQESNAIFVCDLLYFE